MIKVKMDRKIIAVASLLLLMVGVVVFRLASSQAREETVTPPVETTASVPDIKDIQDYKTWTRVHTTPLPLPAPLDTDCIYIAENGDKMRPNPHKQKYFTVYVNEVGRRAMMSQAKPRFPEGSIIIKEKLLFKHDTVPELLTVMVKREKGFNRENGDWEYMVADGARTKIEGRGKLQNCQSCHAITSKTDYVFRTYLPDELRQKLR